MPLRIVFIASDPLTAYRFMDGQLGYLRAQGFDVTVITSPGPLLERVRVREGVRVLGIPVARRPDPKKDLVSLWQLAKALRHLKPHVVVAGTPKAGLLGVMAARLARVPRVVYHLRGLRYVTAKGALRGILYGSETIAAGLAHQVLCNGESLRRAFVADRCTSLEKTWIPAHGTSNGVEVERFRRTPEALKWATEERRRLGIPEGACVVGFVGRFTRDKGLFELSQALQSPALEKSNVHLLAVGDWDSSDPVPEPVIQWMKSSPRVTCVGFVDEPAQYYSMMDVFAFPSYREGFPNAPLEAGAAGLPTVAFRAVGTVDALVDGESGLLLEVGDAKGLGQALLRYAEDPELRRQHGMAAQSRVDRLFRREVVWAALAEWFRGTARELGVESSLP